jgi:hypothetical protein
MLNGPHQEDRDIKGFNPECHDGKRRVVIIQVEPY